MDTTTGLLAKETSKSFALALFKKGSTGNINP
jgi:hypothetical protein